MGGGKSGGGGTKTYNYYGTVAGAVCLGPVDELVAIILAGKEVWPQGNVWTSGQSCIAGQPYVYDAQTWICTTTHTASSTNAPGSGLEGWTEYTFARSSAAYNDFSITDDQGKYYGVLRFYWGTDAQTVNYYLTSAGNDSGEQHPDYKGLCYVVLIDFLFGQEIQSAPNLEIVVRKKAVQDVVTGSAAALTDGQVNLAAAAVEILTSQSILGLTDTDLDSASFISAAAVLQASEQLYGASVLLDSSEDLRSVSDKLGQMADAYFRYNAANKKIEMGVYKHGEIPATYTTLTTDDLTERPKFSSSSWQDVKSRATVRYNSRQLNYQQTSDKVDDARAFAVLKQSRELSVDRPYVTRSNTAVLQGRETLRLAGHVQMTGTLVVRREKARAIKAGDYVLVDVDLEPGGAAIYQFCRVTQRKIPPTGPMTLELLSDSTLAPIPVANGNAPIVPSATAIAAIAHARFVECPTALTGLRLGVVPLVERPDSLIIGASVYFDTDPSGSFTLLGNATNFAARATLNADITALATSIVVNVPAQVDADRFTVDVTTLNAGNDDYLAFLMSISSGQIAEDANGYQIMEICSVSAQALTGTNQYTLTVLRNRLNTTAHAFTAAATEVWLIPRSLVSAFTHGDFDTILVNQTKGTTPNVAQFRLDPYTFAAQRDLSTCSNIVFKFPAKAQSAPTLALSAPASYAAQTYTTPTYPINIPVAGTWSDIDGNLSRYVIALRLSSENSDRIIVDSRFTPCTSKAFATTVQVEKAGTWTLKLRAYDTTGFMTEAAIAVTATGGTGKTAIPYMMINGVRYNLTTPPADTSFGYPGIASYAGLYYCVIDKTAFIPNNPATLGDVKFFCDTPGGTVLISSMLISLTTGFKEFYPPTYNGKAAQALAAPTGNEAHRLTSDIAVYHGWFVQGVAPTGSGLANSNIGVIVFQDWN